MPDQVVFESFWRGIKVSAYTDRYAYDPENASLLFISIAGTEQAVKAVSSAVLGYRSLSILRGGNSEIEVNAHPASHFRVLSTKLPNGAVHQLVVDTRFFGNEDSGSRLVIIPQSEDVSRVVYAQVLAHLACPLIPEWAAWICGQLTDRDLMRQMEGTLRVVEVSASESTVDGIISEGVKAGRISLDRIGGAHARSN
ncbi:MAG: hypothetical protein RDU20_23525 [Desulfomonilaceae bacterium]|nr:hypothetical protein [Desulfomonilaceae bacterium]